MSDQAKKQSHELAASKSHKRVQPPSSGIEIYFAPSPLTHYSTHKHASYLPPNGIGIDHAVGIAS